MPKQIVQFAVLAGHILFIVLSARAQEDTPHTAEEAAVLEAQLEDLDGLRLNPNLAREPDLLALPGLTPDMAWRIVAFRPYRRIEDLRQVPGLSAEHLERIAPYLAFERPRSWRGKFTGRVSRPSNAPNHPNHMRFLERLELSLSNATAFLLIERDPEEPAWNDFVTGHIHLRLPNAHLVIGDIRPQFGQGLIMSRSTRTATGLSSATPVRTRLEGYRASEEHGAVRGALLSTRRNAFALSALYGGARWDAELDAESPQLRLSGLHATQRELARKGALRERLAALRLTMGGPQTHLSASVLKTAFDPSPPAQASHLLLGLDGQWHTDRFTLFGELAKSPEDIAALLGANLRFPGLRLSMIGRRYGPNFQNLHGAAFAAFGTPPNNEWGLFFGAAWRISRRTRLELSLDRHGRIMPQNHPLPQRGERTRLSLHHRLRPGSTLRLTADASARTTQPARRGLRTDLTTRHRDLRLSLWAARVQAGAPGHAIGTRMGLSRPNGLSFTAWFTAFDIHSFDARIYAFAPDVWGGGLLQMLSGRGKTQGLLLVYARPAFRLSTRYGIRHTTGQRTSSWSAQIDLAP